MGAIYGSAEAPLEPGSGGGSHNSAVSGRGGGLVRIEASSVDVDGSITAVGGNPNGQSGAGSGGAIFITCNVFGGAATGVLSADGGANRVGSTSYGGAGGGGRIAVYRARDNYLGAATVDGGIGHDANHNGNPGAITWLSPPPGLVIMFR